MNLSHIHLLAAAMLLPMIAHAGSDFLPPPGNARITRLDNGLELLMVRLPGVPLVGLSAQVSVGSNHEDESTSGSCHMLEHLLFNGTDSLSQEELYAAVDRMGGYNNAHTTNWYTNYLMLVPPASLREGMDIQSGMLYRSILPPEKFEKERGIVLEEIAQGRDRATVWDRMQGEWEHFLFEGSAQELPTLGTPSTIARLTRDEVLSFYRTWYRPNLTRLTVMGPIEFDECLELVNATYGQASPGPRPLTDVAPATLPVGETLVRRLPVDIPHLYLAWPAPALGEPGTLATTALAALLGDDGAGLLATSLFMQGQPPLPGVMFSVNTEPGVAHLTAELDLDPDQDPGEVRDRLTAALAALGNVSVPADRLEEWVLAQRTAEALLLEKPHYFGMSHAGDIVHTGFDSVLGLQARLKALEPADVQAAARDVFAGPPATLLILPEEGEADGGQQASDHVDIIRQPSGLTLIADSTSESGVFALQLMLMHRSAWEGPRRAGAIDLLHRLWADSPRALQLARMGAQLKFHDAEAIPYDDHYTSPAWSFVRMETLSDKALPACALLLDLLRDTPLEGPAFELKRMDALRRAEQRQTSASERAADRMDEELLGSIPAAMPPEGSPSSLESIRLEDLETLRTVILNPANLVFSTRGPLSAASLDSLLGRLLPPAPLAPETLAAVRAFNPGLQPDPSREGFVPLSPQAPVTPGSYTVNDSLGSAQSAIRLGSVFPCGPENAAALRVLFAVISDRMAFDLRETRGWAYSLGAWASARRGQGQAGASMGTRPANRDAALEAMRGYLGHFDGDKLTDDEVSRTVSSLIGRERMRRMASINQAWYRALDVISGDPERTTLEEDALRAVTRADLLRVAAEVLPAMQWITVTVE